MPSPSYGTQRPYLVNNWANPSTQLLELQPPNTRAKSLLFINDMTQVFFFYCNHRRQRSFSLTCYRLAIAKQRNKGLQYLKPPALAVVPSPVTPELSMLSLSVWVIQWDSHLKTTCQPQKYLQWYPEASEVQFSEYAVKRWWYTCPKEYFHQKKVRRIRLTFIQIRLQNARPLRSINL